MATKEDRIFVVSLTTDTKYKYIPAARVKFVEGFAVFVEEDGEFKVAYRTDIVNSIVRSDAERGSNGD